MTPFGEKERGGPEWIAFFFIIARRSFFISSARPGLALSPWPYRCMISFLLYQAWFSKAIIFCRIANSGMFRGEMQYPLSGASRFSVFGSLLPPPLPFCKGRFHLKDAQKLMDGDDFCFPNFSQNQEVIVTCNQEVCLTVKRQIE